MAPAPVPSYAGSGATPTAAATTAANSAAAAPSAGTTATTTNGGNNNNNNNNNNNGSSTKIPRRTSGKSNHSRSYPRGVGLDFRKLAGLTLVSYIDHHGTSIFDSGECC